MPRWSPFEPYFWSLVEKTDLCWNWLGNKCGKGYGRIWRNGKRQAAHRVVYELINNCSISNKIFVCHHCDNKLCVNPKHLFVGNQKDNMQDWTKKGKNFLINNRGLWSNGKHMKDIEMRKKVSILRKLEFRSGKRIIIRQNNGRIMGTRMINEK